MIKLCLLKDETLTLSFFFLESCNSDVIFPNMMIFIPVEHSPSMDCITSNGAGSMAQCRVSFILQARWSAEKDGFVHKALRRESVPPTILQTVFLEAAETQHGARFPRRPFSGVSERGPVNHQADSPYFWVDTPYQVYMYTPSLFPPVHLLTPVILWH